MTMPVSAETVADRLLAQVRPRDGGVTRSEVIEALKSLHVLGLDHLNGDVIRAIMERAVTDFLQPVNLFHRLSWPEFVVVCAHNLRCSTTNSDLLQYLPLLSMVGSVGGVTRTPALNRYYTFEGWREIALN